jgi:hypothetical protein
MFALLLQALCGEREFVVALFGEGGQAREGSAGGSEQQLAAAAGSMQPSGVFGDALGSAALLDRIFESICRPLKVRSAKLVCAFRWHVMNDMSSKVCMQAAKQRV